MNAIFWLWYVTAKNTVRQMLKRPGLLLLYILVIGMVLFFLAGPAPRGDSSAQLSAQWLLGPIGAAVGVLALLYPLFKGVAEGGTLFQMADVGLLFPSPVRPKIVLVYGIVKQMAAMLLLAAYLLLLQINSLRLWLGMSGFSIAVLFAVVFILLYTINVTSMLVYTICSAAPARRRWFAAAGYVSVAVVAAAVLYAFTATGEAAAAARFLADSAPVSYFPVVGWTKAAFLAAAGTSWTALLPPMLGIFFFAVFVTAALRFVSADFYEDVLAVTEKRQTTLTDNRAGRARDIKLFERGFRLKMRGYGAPAIFFRQFAEYARQGFFDSTTLALIITAVIVRFPMGGQESVFDDRYFLFMMAYMMMFFMMFFGTAGLWGRELQKPFIYLIPAKPFAKLAFAVLLTPCKFFVDGFLLSLVLILFMGMPAANLPVYALTFAAFAAVYTAGDILARVIWGDLKTRVGRIFIYLLLSLLLAMPGGILISVFQPLWLGSILCAAWCFSGAAVIVALCSKRLFELG